MSVIIHARKTFRAMTGEMCGKEFKTKDIKIFDIFYKSKKFI